MYIHKSIKEYVDDLAARKPVPGGGSAAALEAALACALISMVLNYTISNKNYKDVKDKTSVNLNKTEGLRKRLLQLVDEDVKAYRSLSSGLKKFGKDSPKLERLYKESCEVPYEVCKITDEALTLLRGLVEYGNKNLITDTAIAALMLESAFFGAKFNVYINLKFINDADYVEKVHKVLSGFEDNMPKVKNEILHISEEAIIK